MLSKRMNSLKPSPTLAITAKAIELQKQGKDVIILSAGEPDFNIPDFIKKAAIKAINDNFSKYTAVNGTLELKKAIIHKFKKDNNLEYQLDEVMAATGGKQILFNALLATLDKDDEVIIPAPYWVSYPDIVSLFDAKPVIIACPIEQDFKLKASVLEKAITNKTKWLILNSPSNPTGSMYSKDELSQIASVLKKYEHVNILCDDIYEHIIYDGNKFYTLLNVDKDLKERTLILNGLSKSFSMTGWRLGFAAGNKKLIKAMTDLQSQSTSNPTSIVQKAATEALLGDNSFIKTWNTEFQMRRDYLLNRITGIEFLQTTKPQGAFYLYINCQGVIGKKTKNGNTINSDNDFCNYLLQDYLVAVVGGQSFGLSPYFRISYATSLEVLKNAFDRIEMAINDLI